MFKVHGGTAALATVGLTALLFDPGVARTQEVSWRHDYSAAKKEAKETNRPLLLDFGTDHCIWCQKLDASTFHDRSVTKLLGERFIPVKVAADREVELAQALNVHSFPTLVFARPDGKILGMHEGYVDAHKMVGQLQRALAETAEQQASPQSKPVMLAAAAPGPKVLTRVSLPPPPEPALSAVEPKKNASAMLDRANADFQAGRDDCCMILCRTIQTEFAESPEAAQAHELEARITGDAARSGQACATLAERLAKLEKASLR